MGSGGGPEIQGYWWRIALWSKLGLKPEDLAGMPHKEVSDLLEIIVLDARDEKAKHRQAEQQRHR
jgi:hypothetical protein